MKQVVIGLSVALLVCGVAIGQQTPGANYEHLKCFDQFIGNWTYEGPLMEDIPGIGTKDTKVTTRISFTWILNKNVVEAVWSVAPAGGTKIAGQDLIGWDVAEKRIIGGGMNSEGGFYLSTMTYNPTTKTLTSNEEGRDGEGKAVTSTIVSTLVDANTLVFQNTARTGGPVQGEGPKITLKRDASPKRPAAVQQQAEETEKAKK